MTFFKLFYNFVTLCRLSYSWITSNNNYLFKKAHAQHCTTTSNHTQWSKTTLYQNGGRFHRNCLFSEYWKMTAMLMVPRFIQRRKRFLRKKGVFQGYLEMFVSLYLWLWFLWLVLNVYEMEKVMRMMIFKMKRKKKMKKNK